MVLKFQMEVKDQMNMHKRGIFSEERIQKARDNFKKVLDNTRQEVVNPKHLFKPKVSKQLIHDNELK